ncbi:MAG: D-alanyl-D-alanine carboxypeptidase/D-alanyl-D-alanine-endopeptidase [Burkholderiales bacterium]|jgi:D-alanyl-D-alanine carboxypeptidase/D-alanyl-D-alanine-endopeptidase (penicillin-binding protein 4)|nr:D-alanyl-D-alanine carboxypeptidase/D-alanyl-D-alanine-endopeptidase [Burkholderiales bacterium]
MLLTLTLTLTLTRVITTALLILLPLSAVAQSVTTLPEPVARALAQAGIPESAIGVYVHEIGAAEPVLAIGAERSLNPASSMKLVTTYAGLEMLGPAYTWNTDMLSDGAIAQDVLNGNLYLKGSGDPKLTLENFWLLLRNLRARGVREIRGDLVLDRRLFAEEVFDPAGFDDQPTRPYNTGPSALLVNFKAVTLQFIPDAATRSVRITVEPPLPQVQIVNNLKFADGGCGDWLGRIKVDSQGNADGARLTFNGTYSADCGERMRSYSVLGHRQYIGALFTYLWREMGGVFTGQVRDGATPAQARPLATARSPSMSEVVRDVNKYSNNVMARQLFLTLGINGAAPTSTGSAANGVKQWLALKGLAVPELVLENGSGLSRIERISARNLGAILLNAWASPVMPELMASLPVAAVDGTMRRRLKSAEIAGQAHIKTGSLSGVRSIAGYVLDAQGNRAVVVFMVNHANAFNAQAAQDAMLGWVHNRDSSNCCGRLEQRRGRK